MIVGVVKIKLYAPWVHSLKEKRMIVKSLCAKLKNKFNVSVIEAEEQDIHQTIVVAVACLACTVALSGKEKKNMDNNKNRMRDREKSNPELRRMNPKDNANVGIVQGQKVGVHDGEHEKSK